MFRNLKYTATLFLLILAFSCKPGKEENENPTPESLNINKINLSQQQEELAGIELGQIKKQLISEIVECSGNIEVPPQSLASVNAPLGGFVKEAKYYVGNFVSKGTLLAVLEHQNYIELQQKFLEAKSSIEYYQEEYKRQGELTVEDAASMKKLQKAKADFENYEAVFLSLKSQLEMIGINPDDIKINGITSTIEIKSPINGYISKLNANIGKYVNENESLYEIVNKEHLHLHLKIFENDILKIQTGQHIKFSLPGNKNEIYEAVVNTIGQDVDETERTINIHAHLTENNSVFRPGMFVNAIIQLSGDSVYSLPSEAIISADNQNFIFIRDNNGFTKIPIEKGIEQNNLVEIINPPQELLNAEIVTKGAYYLNAEIESEE